MRYTLNGCLAFVVLFPCFAVSIRNSVGQWSSRPESLMHRHVRLQEVTRRYVSSELELKWFALAREWKTKGNKAIANWTAYCEAYTADLPAFQRSLELTASLMRTGLVYSAAPDADKYLSRFEIEYGNSTHVSTVKQHIEPLVATLRHPMGMDCNGRGRFLHSTDHILLATAHGHETSMGRNIFLDAGANVGWTANRDQAWLYNSYEQRGIVLDQMVYWEAVPRDPAQVYANIPHRLFPNFVYYNMPAPADLADEANPLNMMTRISRPQDFVAIKIDIDTPKVEADWIDAILQVNQATRSYLSLIDELFFENHFELKPLLDVSWKECGSDGKELYDSMTMFKRLRQLGIRAHYWP